MKRILFLSIAIIGLSTSCKKSSSSSSTPTGISATINGANKNFNIAPAATKSYLGGIEEIDILGAISTGEVITISLSNELGGGKDSIVTGTYSDTSNHFDIEVDYATQVGGSGTAYFGGTSVGGSQGPGLPVTNHVVINISSITSNSIKGTFSGNIYLNGDPTSTALAVTNASFNLPMTQQ